MNTILNEYPLLPVRNTIILPTNSVYLMLENKNYITAIENAQEQKEKIVITSVKDKYLPEINNEDKDKYNFHMMGTLCQINNITKIKNTSYRILVTGLSRFTIKDVITSNGYFRASGVSTPDILDQSSKSIAHFKQLKVLIIDLIKLLPEMGILSHDHIKKIKNFALSS